MVDSCEAAAQPQAGRLGDALAYFWHNFGRFYRTSRAPFGIHLHPDWLSTSAEYLDAFTRFVDALLADFDDVYFVTSHDAIEWMRRPTTVDEAATFEPWRRSCRTMDGNVTANQLHVCFFLILILSALLAEININCRKVQAIILKKIFFLFTGG